MNPMPDTTILEGYDEYPSFSERSVNHAADRC